MTTEAARLRSRSRLLSSPRLEPLLRVVQRPGGLFGVVVLVVLLVCVAFAGVVAPHSPDAQDLAHRLAAPSSAHLLGTDQLGRDVLSRLIYGCRIELAAAVPSVVCALVIGLVLGLTAGYVGGRTDNVLVIVSDTIQSFPAVVLALVLLSLLGPSLRNVMIVIAIAFIPNYVRVSRALVMATKENQFVEAERTLGAGAARISVVHILPNVIAPCLILLAMDIPSAIAVEAGLSFLGVGIQPPTPSWGVILADGFDYIDQSPWPVVFASVTLMVTTLGFTLLGEAMRDTLDPRVAGLTRRARVRGGAA